MSKKILDAVLNGELDVNWVIETISKEERIIFQNCQIFTHDFVAFFLSFLRDKLSTSDAHIKISPRKNQTPNKIAEDTTPTQKCLTFNSSSPLKYQKRPVRQIDGVSPIKLNALKTRTKKKTVDKKDFDLSSFDDFPVMSSLNTTKKQKTPRRITVTPVNIGKTTFVQSSNIEQASLFESSFETSLDGSINQVFFDNKRFSQVSSKTPRHTNELRAVTDVKTVITGSENTCEKDVYNTPVIDTIMELYTSMCLVNLVTNFALEFYFLFSVLTIKDSQTQKIPLPFENISGCVYFAIRCLEKMKHLLILLEVKTLQLLVDNQRFNVFASHSFIDSLKGAIKQDKPKPLNYNSFFLKSPSTGIPFQLDSDNRYTFKNDKHFYALSKQRDGFYSIIREWQEHHSDSDWSLQKLLQGRVFEIIHAGESQLHFAKLFVSQLVDMCGNEYGVKPVDADDTSNSVLLELKKKYPEKFKSLQDRLTRPSSGHNPCPLPSFSDAEVFFIEFINVADSACFNKCLMHVLLCRITELNSKPLNIDESSFDKSDFAESLAQEIKVTVTELRLLARFLGYVVFLPYKIFEQSDEIPACRESISESFKLEVVLYEAQKRHQLLVTTLWVVDFLSMADKPAFQLDVYRTPLKCLQQIYRSRNILVSKNGLELLDLALLMHIGWLFELPHVNPHLSNLIGCCCDIQLLNGNDDSIFGVDDVAVFDKQFVYTLCPYLNDVKKPLLDYAKGHMSSSRGSFRKITAVRTSSINSGESLKMQLLDSFMRYLPKTIKECIIFITERHFANIRHHLSEEIMPKCCSGTLSPIAEECINCDDSISLSDLQKIQASSFYCEHVAKGREFVALQSDAYLKRYLHDTVHNSLQSLLPETINKQLLTVACKVVKHDVCVKTQEWLTANDGLYTQGIETLLRRLLKKRSKMNHTL